MLLEWDLLKKKIIYISTWDADEARTLKDICRDSFYCPFSTVLANIVKSRVNAIVSNKQKKRLKERKNAQN
jgi:hypothetical protein